MLIWLLKEPVKFSRHELVLEVQNKETTIGNDGVVVETSLLFNTRAAATIAHVYKYMVSLPY